MSYDIANVKKIIVPILKKHGIKKAGLFGSLVKGKLTKSSDIDILIELDSEISLLDFIRIKLEIEDALNRKIDLVEYSEIKPILRDIILQEQVAIL